MSIATDAKVRELEKRVIELEKLEARIKILEGSNAPSERHKLGQKLISKARELTDI